MDAPLSVAQIDPDRNARLLLESSHARPPSSCASFQKATMNFTDSIVSLEFRTTLPWVSTSAPPQDQRYGYENAGASPKVWPMVWPIGRPLAFSFLPSARYSSQVAGNFVTPSSANHDFLYAT